LSRQSELLFDSLLDVDDLREIIAHLVTADKLDEAIRLLQQQSVDDAHQIITDLAANGTLTGPHAIRLVKEVIPESERDRLGIHSIP
jgi:hypothetical protein